MKILNISDISSSNAMPVKSGTLQFLQDAHKEALAGLITNIIPTPLSNTIYILSGCKNSGTGSFYNISAGVIYYNGEIFNFDGASFTLTSLQKAYARIETTQYITNADPVQFTDGVNRNVHNIRKIVIENTTTSSGLPEFINFINVGQWKDETDALSLAITALQATDVSLQTQITTITPKFIGSVGNATTFLNMPFIPGTIYPVTGNITSAIAQSDTGSILITISGTLPTNYYVRCIVESLGTTQDNNMVGSTFKKVNTTQFLYRLGEPMGGDQQLKVYLEVIAF